MSLLISDLMQDVYRILQDHTQKRDYDKLDEAGRMLEDILNDQPDDPHVLFSYGTYLHYKGHHGAAIPYFEKVVKFIPDHFGVWSNLGVCWRLLHHNERARSAFKKSLLFEQDALTYNNMSATYINEGCPDEGLAYARKAMELDPNAMQAKWNYGLLMLEKECWAEGFEHYDAGFLCNERQARNYADEAMPWWRGEPGTVVLFDEQGLGDRILFMNLLHHITPENFPNNEFILEVHPRLEGLYRRSFPWFKTVYTTVKESHIEWPKKHTLNYRCAIASLTHDFTREPYLKPDQNLVDGFKKQFGDGPVVGFSWFGGVRKTHGHQRSIKLGWMQDIVKSGGTWVSLQYNDWAKDKIARFNAEHNTRVIHIEDQKDYDHTTAAIAACDHVVTVCNTVAHTAGALGKSCWVLVPKAKAWRYPSGDHFPWYSDNVEMIHQKTTWDALLLEVKERIKEWIDSQS